jgi:hypothetical protein
MLPSAQEIEFVEWLKQSLLLYRSGMGQPGQQEFLEFSQREWI